MDGTERKKRAVALFQQAYHAHMRRDFEEATRLYQASIACYPTAEAHTYLGWAYSALDRLDDAISECLLAIEVDPRLGNPYNDIGSYLIKQGKYDEAIPWLQRAIDAPRYEPRHFPHCNLGRVYWQKGLLQRAIEEFERALAIEPEYEYAQTALESVRQQLN